MNLEELKTYAINQISTILGADMNKVSALAFQGGIGRGKFDRNSDIDILIAFEKDEDSKGVIKGYQKIDGKGWDIYHLSFDKVSPKKWKDKLRYVYGYETLIVFDKTEKLKQLCKEALLSHDEIMDRTIYKIKKIGNRGITYKGIVNEMWRGIKWDRPELWLERGNEYAAHMRLNQANELLIELIYSINGLPIPSPKWKHHLVTELEWTPSGLKEKLYRASLVLSLTKDHYSIRANVLIDILSECIDRVISVGLLPEDIGAYYIPKYAKNSDNTEVDIIVNN